MIQINSDEKFAKALRLAIEKGDTSFADCFDSMVAWAKKMKPHPFVKGGDPIRDYDWFVSIGNDYCEHSFSWRQQSVNGDTGIVGGFLFHGFPGEKDGSMAVTFSNKAWQIHT